MNDMLDTQYQEILNVLNPEQYKAATAPFNEHVQILAGPGTGKTKALAARIAWLVKQDIEIVALTFTNAAAKELVSRLGDDAKKVWAGTFHSLCARMLFRHGPQVLGLQKNFGIAEERVKKRFIKRIFETINTSKDPVLKNYKYMSSKKMIHTDSFQNTLSMSQFSSQVSMLKSKGFTPANCLECEGIKKHTKALYTWYQELLSEANMLDFDDLLIFGKELFQKNPKCIPVQCVLVDEYQDTNIVQFDIMCALAGDSAGITVVGDPDQSIYSFRGAEPENFSKMIDRYPSTKVFYLETNYRSNQPILDASMGLINQSTKRENEDRRLISAFDNNQKGKPQSLVPLIITFSHYEREADSIAQHIRYLTEAYKDLISLKDIAILFRYRRFMPRMEQALLGERLRYKTTGNVSFWESKEIDIIVNYLKIIDSPFQDDALLETVNVPSRNIGTVALKHLDVFEKGYRNAWEKLEFFVSNPHSRISLSDRASSGLIKYHTLISDCKAELQKFNNPQTVVKVIDKIIADSKLMDHLAKYSTKDPEVITDNIEFLKSLVLRSLTDSDADENQLHAFLTSHSLTDTSTDPDTTSDAVSLSTFHGAKGLEWKVVFIPNLGELTIYGNADEERRTLFVAMTRAESLLYMSHSGMRDTCNFATSFLSDKVLELCKSSSSRFVPKSHSNVVGSFHNANPSLQSKININVVQKVTDLDKNEELESIPRPQILSGFKSAAAVLLEENAIKALREQNADKKKRKKAPQTKTAPKGGIQKLLLPSKKYAPKPKTL